MLYRGVNDVSLPVLINPQSGEYTLLYPSNHYVIIKNVISDGNSQYGEISDQSKLVFTSPQDKKQVQDNPNGYLALIQYGVIYLTRLL